MFELDANEGLENRAKEFAAKCHYEAKNFRKYTGDPYIVHPAAVVKLVRSVPHTIEMLAAAWLHDTVEDTLTELCEIEKNFGAKVGSLVYWLTDISLASDGNRAVRKAIDKDHIALAPASAKTIKLADLIDNSDSIIEYDRGFAKVYMEEKVLLLEVLKEGDTILWDRANEIVRDYFALKCK